MLHPFDTTYKSASYHRRDRTNNHHIHCLKVTSFAYFSDLSDSTNMYRSILVASLATLAVSQNAVTMNAISQIGDGQIQAPTDTQPIVPPAQSPPPAQAPPASESSAPYSNPFTIYTSQTNEWGVVTGMPSVVTSQPQAVATQPEVVTSQPLPPPPAVPTFPPSSNSTTSSLRTSTVAASTPAEATTSTPASSPSVAPLNGAETNRVAGAGLALFVVSVGFFML